MRFKAVWYLVAAVVCTACGDDAPSESSTVTCGTGTHLEGSQCVADMPDAGTVDGSGGANFEGDVDNSSSGSDDDNGDGDDNGSDNDDGSGGSDDSGDDNGDGGSAEDNDSGDGGDDEGSGGSSPACKPQPNASGKVHALVRVTLTEAFAASGVETWGNLDNGNWEKPFIAVDPGQTKLQFDAMLDAGPSIFNGQNGEEDYIVEGIPDVELSAVDVEVDFGCGFVSAERLEKGDTAWPFKVYYTWRMLGDAKEDGANVAVCGADDGSETGCQIKVYK